MAPATATNNGITGGNYDVYGANRTIPRAMTTFTAIAWYNSIEIFVLSAYVFKKHRGLYFWCVMVCAIATPVDATGAWLYQNVSTVPKLAADIVMMGGWTFMIPSQSMVLWSRLHLITPNRRLLRFLLCLIIFDSIVFMTPTIVLNFGSLLTKEKGFLDGYSVFEKIQMCVFTAQEFLISCVYLKEVRKVSLGVHEKRARGMVKQLVLMNILIIALDIVVLSIEFCNMFMIQVTFKPLIYSVKLKVEFAVLSKIINLVRDKRIESQQGVGEVVKPPNSAKRRGKSADLAFSTDLKKHHASPRLSTAFTSWASLTTNMHESRKKSVNGTQTQNCGGSVLHSLQMPETALALEKLDEEDGKCMRSLQRNVPAEWRLSIGHEALSGPNLYEIRQLSLVLPDADDDDDDDEEEDAVDGVNDVYPGRLS